MRLIIFTLFVSFLFLSCNEGRVRTPNNQIVADQKNDDSANLISDPSGDPIIVDETDAEEQEVVTFVDCGPRMMADVIYIDGKIDENGNLVSQTITPDVKEQTPYDAEACKCDYNGDEKVDCVDRSAPQSSAMRTALLATLERYNIKCAPEREIYMPGPDEE